MKRCALYLRVSVEDRSVSLDAQEEGGRAWAAARGDTVVKVYRDDGVSGAEWLKRPGVVELQADVTATPRPWDFLVVRDLDRLGRDSLRLGLLLETLHEHGARLHVWSTGEEVSADPLARGLLMLRGVVAEQERAQIAHRTRVGLKQRAERGLCVGKRPYGYALVRRADGVHYVVDERESAVVLEIYQRRAAGESGRSIALDLNRREVPSPEAGGDRAVWWCRGEVCRIATNPRYRGEATWGRRGARYKAGTKIPVTRADADVVTYSVPPIVDPDLWQRAQRNTAAHAAATGGHVHRGPAPRHLLVGLATCGACGGPIGSSHTSSGSGASRVAFPAYVCLRARDQGRCEARHPRKTSRLDGPVLDWLAGEVLNPDVVAAGIERARAAVTSAPVDPRLDAARTRVVELERKVGRLVRAVEEEDAPDILQALRTRRAELADARAELAGITAPTAPVTPAEAAALLACLADVRAVFEAARAERPDLLRAVLGAVLVRPIRVTASGRGRNLVFDLDGEAAPGAILNLRVPGLPGMPGLEEPFSVPDGPGTNFTHKVSEGGMSRIPWQPGHSPLLALRVTLRRVA